MKRLIAELAAHDTHRRALLFLLGLTIALMLG